MMKKGFIWYLFEREAIYLVVGLVVGIVLTILVAQGYVPLPFEFPICPMQAAP